AEQSVSRTLYETPEPVGAATLQPVAVPPTVKSPLVSPVTGSGKVMSNIRLAALVSRSELLLPESDTGSRATRGAKSARRRSTTPPETVLPARAGSGRVVARIRARSCCAVQVGFWAATRAATPVTIGVAIEVPESKTNWANGGTVSRKVLATSTPGAPRSTVVAPKFEKSASASRSSVAATESTLSSRNDPGETGNVSLSAPSLPAATTCSSP